jgi:hypothetical protein
VESSDKSVDSVPSSNPTIFSTSCCGITSSDLPYSMAPLSFPHHLKFYSTMSLTCQLSGAFLVLLVQQKTHIMSCNGRPCHTSDLRRTPKFKFKISLHGAEGSLQSVMHFRFLIHLKLTSPVPALDWLIRNIDSDRIYMSVNALTGLGRKDVRLDCSRKPDQLTVRLPGTHRDRTTDAVMTTNGGYEEGSDCSRSHWHK